MTLGRKKRNRQLLFQLLVVIGFLTLIWFSFGQNVLAPRTQVEVPERLGTLELVSSIEGSEALAQVNRLHGTGINLVTAYIAEYASGNQRVTVWAGGVETSGAAAELTRRMVEGIAGGNSGFSNLQRLTIVDHEIFQVDGAGGEHFFYRSRKAGEMVIWLTVEAVEARPILEQAVKLF